MPSVLCVRGAPFKLSRRFEPAEVADAGAGAGARAAAGFGLEEEATGAGVGAVVGFGAAFGALLEGLEGSGLIVTGGEPGAGEGEGRAEPVEGVSSEQGRRRTEDEPDGL